MSEKIRQIIDAVAGRHSGRRGELWTDLRMGDPRNWRIWVQAERFA